MLLTTEIESVNEQRLNQSGITFFEYDFPSSASDGLVDLVIWVDNANLHYSFVAVCEKEGKPVTYLGSLWWTCYCVSRKESGVQNRNVHIPFGN